MHAFAPFSDLKIFVNNYFSFFSLQTSEQNLVSIHLKTSPETSKFYFGITQRFNFAMVFSPREKVSNSATQAKAAPKKVHVALSLCDSSCCSQRLDLADMDFRNRSNVLNMVFVNFNSLSSAVVRVAADIITPVIIIFLLAVRFLFSD